MGHELIAALILVASLVVLLLARRALGTFVTVAAFLVAALLYLRYGFDPGIPASAYKLYAAVSVVAVLLYATSSDELSRAFWGPVRATLVEPRRLPVLALCMLLVPAVVAWRVRAAVLPSRTPPPKIRSVHPSPPATISFAAPGSTEPKTVQVVNANSPLRALETSDAAKFRDKVAHGKVVYYENCFYCHGDMLAADGHYAGAVAPPPANFQDPGVLPQLEETFIFWRIAKGGPGLPDEATPYDSSMPVWEKFLTEDDIWSASLFLYDQMGYQPRHAEAAGGGH